MAPRAHPGSSAIAASANNSCLRGAHAYFVGLSETLNIVDALSSSLQCTHRAGVAPTNRFEACEDRKLRNSAYSYREVGQCKEDLYSRTPYVAKCPRLGGGAELSFVWKTHMRHDHYDSLLFSRVATAARAAPTRTVYLVLGGGVAHFAQLPVAIHAGSPAQSPTTTIGLRSGFHRT